MTARTKPRVGGRVFDFGTLAYGSLFAFVFTIPFEEIVTIPGVGSITRLLGFALVATGAAALIRRGRVHVRSQLLFSVVALLFVLWNLATAFWSYAPSATVSQFVRYIQLFAFVWFLFEHARSRERLTGLMQAFVLGNYVAVAITLVTVFVVRSGGFREIGRFNANEFAIVAALAIPVAMYLVASAGTQRWRLLNALYPFVALVAIVVGASRGGFIVGLVALAAVPLTLSRLSSGIRVILFVVLALATAAAFEVVPRAVPDLVPNLERLAGTGEELAEGTLTGRTLIWEAALTLFFDSPVVGVGAGAPRYALESTSLGRMVAVHNAPLSVAAGGGLIGLGLFAGMFVLAFLSALFSPADVRGYLIILFGATFVAILPANVEDAKAVWFLLGLLACHRPIVLSLHGGPVLERSVATSGGTDGASDVQRVAQIRSDQR